MFKPTQKDNMVRTDRPIQMVPAENSFGRHLDSSDTEIAEDIARSGVALSANETVSRFGSASAEYVKGYRGIDNETEKKIKKYLAKIAESNVSPEYAARNIKQQAGYAAEVAATSRDNAEAIIQRSEARTWRSDDLPQFGTNDDTVDRVQVLNGEIIEGTQAQMKFVGNREKLFKNIAEENRQGKSDLSRYRGIKLELPSEQFDGAEHYCRSKATELRKQAEVVQQKGKPDLADRFRREADNYDQLAVRRPRFFCTRIWGKTVSRERGLKC